MNPLVSIIIPAKNESHFIGECLDSIKNQTFSDWEVIVIDDNSDDSTFEIVQKYALNDNRIKVLKNDGIGIIHALRLAFRTTEGMYITRMDADDRMKPNKIEVLYGGLCDFGEGFIAVGGVEYFSENKKLGDGYKRYEQWLNNLTMEGENFKDIFKECVIPSPCWMVHRTDLNKVNAFEENRYPEDYDLAFRFYEAGFKVVPTSEIIHEWRDYPTRTSRTDEHYSDQTFTTIKVHYFLKIHFNSEKKIVIIGDGNRGKALAKQLTDKSIDFEWLGNNPNKIGKHIYDKVIQPIDEDFIFDDKQLLVTISNKTYKQKIKKFFDEIKLNEHEDYFWFA